MSLEQLLQKVVDSESSNFYRNIWSIPRDTTPNYLLLPFASRTHFESVPLSERTYKKEKGFTKIVQGDNRPFLIHAALADMKDEVLGTACERPLVLLSNSHEAIEKALWFYEHDMLPLVGESGNLSVAAYAAARYSIDAIVSDSRVLDPFLQVAQGKKTLSNVRSVTIIGPTFDVERVLVLQRQFPMVRPTLALPETGTLGLACTKALKRGMLIFHPTADVILSIYGNELVATKTRLLTTPIIKYQTQIPMRQMHDVPCGCQIDSFEMN